MLWTLCPLTSFSSLRIEFSKLWRNRTIQLSCLYFAFLTSINLFLLFFRYCKSGRKVVTLHSKIGDVHQPLADKHYFLHAMHCHSKIGDVHQPLADKHYFLRAMHSHSKTQKRDTNGQECGSGILTPKSKWYPKQN